MSRLTSAIVLIAAIMIAGAFAWVPAATRSASVDSLQLKIDLQIEAGTSGHLFIKNLGANTVRLYSPANALALYFLVTDDQGNQLMPTFFGKSSTKDSYFELPSGSTHRYAFEDLAFSTRTARYGYGFEYGKTYRIVVVYRPRGLNGPGYTSNEHFSSL